MFPGYICNWRVEHLIPLINVRIYASALSYTNWMWTSEELPSVFAIRKYSYLWTSVWLAPKPSLLRSSTKSLDPWLWTYMLKPIKNGDKLELGLHTLMRGKFEDNFHIICVLYLNNSVTWRDNSIVDSKVCVYSKSGCSAGYSPSMYTEPQNCDLIISILLANALSDYTLGFEFLYLCHFSEANIVLLPGSLLKNMSLP